MKNQKSKPETIQTIILCGGKGTRLREETEFKPKPMVEIGGLPILVHIMKIYAHYGFKNFILPLGYKADMIKEYFLERKYYESDFSLNTGSLNSVKFHSNNKPQENYNIIFSETGLETPHGERVMMVEKYIKGKTFMLTYGDGVSDVDINEVLRFHRAKHAIVTLTGVHPISRWGLVNADSDGIVTQFAQKPLLFDYTNGGFMVMEREFFKYLKKGDFIEDAIMRMIPEKKVALYQHEGFWYGMDTYRDVEVLNEMWQKNPKWKIWK